MGQGPCGLLTAGRANRWIESVFKGWAGHPRCRPAFSSVLGSGVRTVPGTIPEDREEEAERVVQVMGMATAAFWNSPRVLGEKTAGGQGLTFFLLKNGDHEGRAWHLGPLLLLRGVKPRPACRRDGCGCIW